MVSEMVMSEENRSLQHETAVPNKLDVKAFVHLREIRGIMQVQFCSAHLVSPRDASICQIRAQALSFQENIVI